MLEQEQPRTEVLKIHRVTISLDLKYIGASKIGDEIIGHVKILKKTKTLVFLFCELKCNNKIITSASGVWKILKIKS